MESVECPQRILRKVYQTGLWISTMWSFKYCCRVPFRGTHSMVPQIRVFAPHHPYFLSLRVVVAKARALSGVACLPSICHRVRQLLLDLIIIVACIAGQPFVLIASAIFSCTLSISSHSLRLRSCHLWKSQGLVRLEHNLRRVNDIPSSIVGFSSLSQILRTFRSSSYLSPSLKWS
jgi:hypothetical protein